jgi:hypothetical protein
MITSEFSSLSYSFHGLPVQGTDFYTNRPCSPLPIMTVYSYPIFKLFSTY